MFLSVYKTTLKNLFRSLLFWLMLVFLIGFSIYKAILGGAGTYSQELGEMIWDTDPRYVLEREYYVSGIDSYCNSTMLYIMPLVAIVSAVVILSRDYGDGYYEIERAGGRRPFCYLTGRLAALLTVNLLAVLLAIVLRNHLYVFTRGGVAGMTTGEYLADSSVRVLRSVVCTTWPPVTMFVCFTYAVGTLFKNSWAGAITSSAYVLINYLFTYQLRFRIPEWYGRFLSPFPDVIRGYVRFYDYYDTSEKFEQFLERYGTSLNLMLAGIGWIVGMALIYSLVSYLRIRRREI